jgi:hemoglobin
VVSGQQIGAGSSATLYARLGGYDFLARFVDTAFPRVATQPQLARLFRGHSRDSQMRQRQLIVDALCHHTGGPCLYIGRPLTAVHDGLGITDDDWRVFVSVRRAARVGLGG